MKARKYEFYIINNMTNKSYNFTAIFKNDDEAMKMYEETHALGNKAIIRSIEDVEIDD